MATSGNHAERSGDQSHRSCPPDWPRRAAHSSKLSPSVTRCLHGTHHTCCSDNHQLVSLLASQWSAL